MKRTFGVFVTLIALAGGLAAQRFTIDDLLKVRRVSDPQLSPDGRLVASSLAT
jgi:hypothetical protein